MSEHELSTQGHRPSVSGVAFIDNGLRDKGHAAKQPHEGSP